MKAIILAGGYAKRLHCLTMHIPKALLPITGKPIIDFMVEKIDSIRDIDKIFISTNLAFTNHFQYWQLSIQHRMKTSIEMIIEPTEVEEKKLGAIGGLEYVIRQANLTDSELLIVAGDNLFEFKLDDLIKFYRQHGENPVVAFHDLKFYDIVRERFGVGVLDKQSKIVSFEEKPAEPKSTLASTGCYVFPPSTFGLLQQYLKDRNNPDAPGHFINWLSDQDDVDLRGFVFDEAWYDIGTLDSYNQVNKDYKGRVKI